MKKNFFKKKLTAYIVAIAAFASLIPSYNVFAEREYAADFSILGSDVKFSNPIFSKYDTVFVPLEELCGYLNIDLTLTAKDEYTIERMGKNVTVQSGNMACVKDGKTVLLPVHPVVKNQTLYVPAEFFSLCLDIPLTKSDDLRSANIEPNIYKISIDEEHAAGISAVNPDKDTLELGENASDMLFCDTVDFPERERSVYYLIDFSEFANKNIRSIELNVCRTRGYSSDFYPSLSAIKTAVWNKKDICYNNKPEEYPNDATAGISAQAESFSYGILDITKIASQDAKLGKTVSFKLLGKRYADNKTPKDVQVRVKGVNTPDAPYVSVLVDETYDFPVAVQKNNSGSTEADAKTTKNMALLSGLGIIKSTDEFPLDLETPVTRAEFLSYALRLRGSDRVNGSGTPYYADVSTDLEFFTNVSEALGYGYISGEAGSNFRPYDDTKIAEALVIIGKMIGYDKYAANNGGYSAGYFKAASQGGLYKGASIADDILTFKKMFDILVNALNASAFTISTYSLNEQAYAFDKDTTILTLFWDAKTIEGKVVADEYSALAGETSMSGHVKVGTKILRVRPKLYKNLLGYRVKAYYNNDDELLYMYPLNTDIKTVDFSDIADVSESAGKITVKCDTDSKTKSYSFTNNDVVIYNGKAVNKSDISKNLIKGDSGTITFVDKELIIINAYKTTVVYKVDVENSVISDAYDPYDNAIRLSSVDYTLTNAYGSIVELEELEKNDVISVAVSLDKKLINGIVSKKSISGKITSVRDEGTDDMQITINKTAYNVKNLIEAWTKFLSVGVEGTFLVDTFGNIVGMVISQDSDTSKNSYDFGYLLDMKYSTSKDKVVATMMVSNSERYVKNYFADRVKIDGVLYKDNTNGILTYFTDASTGAIVKQGFAFTMNSNGEISSIDTAKIGKIGTVEVEVVDNTINKRYRTGESGATTLSFKTGSGKLGDLFFWSIARTLSINVPADENDISEYELITGGIANDSNLNVEIYSIGNKKPTPDIVVMRNYGLAQTVGENAFAVFDKTATTIDEDGEIVSALYYYTAPDTRKSVIVEDENKTKVTDLDLHRGDIIRVASDLHGKLGAIKKDYDYKSRTITTDGYAGYNVYNSINRIYGGYNISKFDNYVGVSKNTPPTSETDIKWVNMSETSNFYKYEVTNKGIIVSKASADDIIDFKTVPYAPNGLLIQSRYESLKNIFLVELAKPAGTGIYKAKFLPGNSNVTGDPPAAIQVDIGDTITLPENTMLYDEYDFAGWNYNGNIYQPGDEFTITGTDTEFKATWDYVGKQYNITFEGGTDATGNGANLKYAAGKNFTLPANPFTKSGYKFVCWDYKGTKYNPGDNFVVPAEDTVFTAEWIKAWGGGVSETAPSTDGNGYYMLSSGEDIAWFAKEVNSGNTAINAILTEDIYMNYGDKSNNWFSRRIGIDDSHAYTGTFDGNGKTIYNLYIEGGSSSGFFGTLSGNVKNLTISDCEIVSTSTYSSSRYFGVLAGTIRGTGTTVSGITVSGNISVKDENCYANGAGGIVGNIYTAMTIENCTSYVNMDMSKSSAIVKLDNLYSHNNGIGGIVGKYGNLDVVINNCKNYGTINAPKTACVGGIIGYVGTLSTNAHPYSITNCQNYGNITGYNNVGGIVGRAQKAFTPGSTNTNSGTITAAGE